MPAPGRKKPTPTGPGQRTIRLMARLDAMPGAEAKPLTMSKSSGPIAVIYKICGKMFAILATRGDEYVILKCDPTLAHALRQQYEGVGHRSHLDKRFWISVDLTSDVPAAQIRRMVEHSYGLVCAGLTRKQQAALIALRRN
jgi:predicted DNA-binding protein (MmcQ/YjbR family)